MKRFRRLYEVALLFWLRRSGGRLPPFFRRIAFVRRSALGDVLMTTPALREFARRNPHVRVSLFTDYPEILVGLPFLRRVLPSTKAPPLFIELRYENADRTPRHIAGVYGEQLGIKLRDFVPTCHTFSGEEESWRHRLPDNRPVISVSRHASDWTPNKNWPDAYWDELLAKLAAFATVVEFGAKKQPKRISHPHYQDARGETSLESMVGLVAASDLYIGPISGPIHVAAAVGTPAVVIYSGYELPEYTHYPLNVAINHPVECAPCWLRTPCPHQLKCVTAISVESVFRAVGETLVAREIA